MQILSLDAEEQVRVFNGHSGCKVALWRRGDTYFVRKTSASVSYNARFQSQIEKQRSLSRHISIPRILRAGEENGLVVADMEFVAGEDFRSFAPKQRIDAIVGLVEQILSPLRELQATGIGDVAEREFLNKLDELERTVPGSAFFAPYGEFLSGLIDRLLIMDWTKIPQSMCHGDLTLENIMIREQAIVFIDPLDGAMSSVWMDVAKLIQDLDTGWSLRALLWEDNHTPEARLLRMLTRYLSDELRMQLSTSFPAIEARLPQMRAMQALRVLPYVKDPKTFAHVVDGLKQISF